MRLRSLAGLKIRPRPSVFWSAAELDLQLRHVSVPVVHVFKVEYMLSIVLLDDPASPCVRPQPLIQSHVVFDSATVRQPSGFRLADGHGHRNLPATAAKDPTTCQPAAGPSKQCLLEVSLVARHLPQLLYIGDTVQVLIVKVPVCAIMIGCAERTAVVLSRLVSLSPKKLVIEPVDL